MTTNLAMDLRRIAQQNERQPVAAAARPRSARPQPRMSELQQIFRRLEAAGAGA